MKPLSLKLKKGHKRKRSDLARKPINVLASGLTTMNLYCGVASIFASMAGKFDMAAYFILLAIIFDTLDGSVAKLTKSASEFGKQLDSLCDVVSFGASPAVLIYSYFLQQDTANTFVARMGSIMAAIFVICGALRLARYNTYQATTREYFSGLPIPAAGGTIASFVIFANHFQLDVTIWILGPLTMALALLMVSTIRYPKDKMKLLLLRPKHAFPFLLLLAVGVAALGAASDHPPVALFPLGAAYVLFGLGDAAYTWFTRKGAPRAAKIETGESQGKGGGSGSSKTGDLL